MRHALCVGGICSLFFSLTGFGKGGLEGLVGWEGVF